MATYNISLLTIHLRDRRFTSYRISQGWYHSCIENVIYRTLKRRSNTTGTIVFDLETKTLIPRVQDEILRNQAIRNLEPSVICVYDFDSDSYAFYTLRNIKDFIVILNKATKIVGYNILGFDYLVLEKYGLKKHPIEKTFDLMDFIRQETSEWIGLHALSKENLGRGKLVKGKAMVGADPITLFEGCKGDVLNTKELFELYLKGKLKYKHLKGRKPWKFFDDDHVEMGDGSGYIPFSRCPYCGSSNLSKFDELEDSADEMTEGQFADYMAGHWGTVECLDCDKSIDFD